VGRLRLDHRPMDVQILDALRRRGPMTRGQITAYYVRPSGTRAAIVRGVLEQLEAAGLVRSWTVPGPPRGLHPSVWYGVVEGALSPPPLARRPGGDPLGSR
jgi:hypothetical protein